MKNAFLRYSSTCASLLFAGALVVTSASAGARDLATVNFVQPVAVGSMTLPAGHYTITEAGQDAFVIQSDNGQATALIPGQRIENGTEASKTQIILSGDGGTLHLAKLYIAGESSAYEFGR